MSGSRLKLIRQEKKMSQRDFGQLLGIAQTTYANYENDKASVPDDLKRKFAQMGVNLHWLITGEGSMTLDESFGKQNESLIAEKSTTFITPKGKSEIIRAIDGIYSVPILAQKVSAGNGQGWIDAEYTGESIPILERFVRRYPKDKLCAAEVRGDSMTGIMLFDSDIVVFVRDVVEGDGVYVLALREEVLVKRLSFNAFSETVSVISENEKYKEIEVPRGNESLRILGKVVGWVHHHPY